MKAIFFYKLALICTIAMLYAVGMEGQETMFQSFQAEPDLSITVISNWDTLRLQTHDDETKAKTLYNGTEWKTELQLRGVSRRVKCDSSLTPFRLQFKRKELKKAGFKEMRNHKIVTYCKESDAGLENLQEEILIYQLYEILTDQSFRSVVAQLSQRWTDDEHPERTIQVLIVEPNKEMADRLGGIEVKTYSYPADSINAESYNRNALFQFMIGNFDWSQAAQRNIKTIAVNSKALIVPYDFDYSAIVSPSYASMPANFGLVDFKDRIYLGEYFIDQIPEMEAMFLGKKEQLQEHILNFEGLKKFRRKQINKYLDIFFDFIEDPDHVLEFKTILPFK